MTVTIREVMTDPELFGEQFSGDSWQAWIALLCGFYGLSLNHEERRIFEAITGRSESPQKACEELWLVVGRRGGKSQCAAILAVYEACFNDHRDKLSPGEVATCFVLAADRKQARTVFRYITGLLHANPMLERLIVREDKESIELANRAVIEVGTASFRTTRGYTYSAVIADEIAFWRSEDSANPDHEIIAAVRPGLASLDGPLIALSSPYSRRGELWNTYRAHYGEDGPVLVAQAETRIMNPRLPERVIQAAYERDAVSAAAEYGAEFRSDIAAFIDRTLVDNHTRSRPAVIPPQSGKRYTAFVDVAGGGADEYTLSISHTEGERIVVDAIFAKRGDPAEITGEYAKVLHQYGVRQITGDRYAADWPVQEYRKHGITMQPAKLNRSELYLEFLPLLQTGRVELPPDQRTGIQFAGLERRTSRAGRDTVDHPPGGSDDRSNAVAGAAVHANKPVPKLHVHRTNFNNPNFKPSQRAHRLKGF